MASGADRIHSLDICDRSMVANVARSAFAILNLVLVCYFVAMLYLLRAIQTSKSKIKPTPMETLLAIASLWIIHQILETLLSTSIHTSIQALCGRSFATDCLNARAMSVWPVQVGRAVWTWWGSFTPLLLKILVTWLMSSSIFSSTSAAAQAVGALRDPLGTFAIFQRRCLELVEFTGGLFSETKDPTFQSRTANSHEWNRKTDLDESNYSRIELRRHQDRITDDRQRTLNWDLKVDHEALQEMMEILGPPGGFGELGFNISQGQICFGAMGVGTRFNLTFVLGTERRSEKTLKHRGSARKKKSKK